MQSNNIANINGIIQALAMCIIMYFYFYIRPESKKSEEN